MKLKNRWLKIVLGAGVFLLLAPLPAYAFVFTTPWRITSEVRTGGAPRVETNIRADPNVAIATFNFGDFRARTSGRSTISASRDFRVAAPNELLGIINTFAVRIKNANYSVALSIIPLRHGGSTPVFPRQFNSAGNTEQRFVSSQPFTNVRLNGGAVGLYRLTVNITYTKVSSGLWNNVNSGDGDTEEHRVGATAGVVFAAGV